jgi:hypothetical protein
MDIPFGQGALVDLGRSVTNLGEGISEIAIAYQNAAAATEYFKAKNYVDSQFAGFLDGIGADPDYRGYNQKLQDFAPTVSSGVDSLTTMQKSKSMANQYYAETLLKVQKATLSAARAGIVRDAEGEYQKTIQELKARGDEQGLKDAIATAAENGIIADPAKEYKENLPETKYNATAQMMAGWDYKSQVDFLASPDAGRLTGLDVKQLDTMRKHFDDQYAFNAKMLSDQKQKVAHDIFMGVLKGNENPDKPISYDYVVKAEQDLVDTPYFEKVHQIRQDLDKRTEELGKFSQGSIYSNYATDMTLFKFNAGQKVAPWGPTDVNRLYQNKKIDLSERDKLVELWGEVQTYKQSKTSADDPAKVNELYQIAFDTAHGWSPSDKNKLIEKKGYLGSGVTGSTYQSIIDAANNDQTRNKDWASFLDGLNKYYDALNTAYSGQNSNPSKLQELAQRRVYAIQSMYDALRKNPNDPSAWKTIFDKLQTTDTVKVVNDNTRKALTPPGGATPNLPPGWENLVRWINPKLGMSAEVQLDVGRQTDASFAQNPDAYPIWRTALPRIESDYRAMLPADARDAQFIVQNDNLYFQKGNVFFTVRGKIEGGVIRTQVYRASKGAKGFSKWEPVK